MTQQKNSSGLIFSRQLRAEMDSQAITQEVLAAAVGVSQGAVSGWLKGAVPRADKLDKIANKLGLSVQWLLTGDGPRQGQMGMIRDAAKFAADNKDKVDPQQVLFDLVIERERVKRLEAANDSLTQELERLRAAMRELLKDGAELPKNEPKKTK